MGLKCSAGISQMTERRKILGSRINEKSPGSSQLVVAVHGTANSNQLQQIAEDIVSREIARQLHG
jgi:hypothetical protein